MIVVIALAHDAMTSDGIEIRAVVSMSFFLEPSFEALQSPPHSPSISPTFLLYICPLTTTIIIVLIQSTPRQRILASTVIDMIGLVDNVF